MKPDELFTRHKTLVIIVLFLVALAPRLYRLDSKSVWLDEAEQASRAAVNPFALNLADLAASNQQPPMDDFFESIFIKNFGYNETGIRMHAALMGALAAVFFFLLLRRIVPGYAAILLGTLIFIFHPFLIRYSQEGRPISGGIFFGVLYLYFLFDFFLRPGTDRPVRSFAVLTAVQTAFLLSVGFQPVVFLVVSSICLAPNLFSKERRHRTLLAYLSSASAFIISLPILRMVINRGSVYVSGNSILDMLGSLFQGFKHVTASNILPLYRTILGDYFLFFAAAAAAGIFGFIQYKKGVAPPARMGNYGFTSSYFLMFFLVYPLIYITMFRAAIDSTFRVKPRYYLSFAPVCLALVAVAVGFSLFPGKKTRAVSKTRRYVPILVSGILGILFIYSFTSNLQSVSQRYKTDKAEWKKVYDIFLYDSEPGDIAYMLNLVDPKRWQSYFNSKRIYYDRRHARSVVLKRARYNIPADMRNPELWKRGRNIYIVTGAGSEKIKKDFFKGVENIDLFLFHKISVIRVKKGPLTKEHLVSTLRTLKEKLSGKYTSYLLYEILISIDLDRGDIEKAGENIEALEALDRKKRLKKFITPLKKRLERLRRGN